jgi:hypothetical protein
VGQSRSGHSEENAEKIISHTVPNSRSASEEIHHLMGPENSFPFSQQPTTGPQPEPDESSADSRMPFLSKLHLMFKSRSVL